MSSESAVLFKHLQNAIKEIAELRSQFTVLENRVNAIESVAVGNEGHLDRLEGKNDLECGMIHYGTNH